MPCVSRASAVWPFTVCGQHPCRSRHGGVGCGCAYVGDRLCFGLRDLGLGHLGAAGDEVFHPRLGFGGDALGFGLGAGDDLLGFLHRALAPGAILGDQLLRLVLQPAGVIEFGLDASRAMIERLEDLLVHAEIGEAGHQDHERDGGPECLRQTPSAQPFSVASTAVSTALASGATPESRCTMAAAASVAIERTLPIAVVRVAAIDFSASASLAAQPVFEQLALLVGLLVQLVADIAADRLCVRAGGRKLGLVGLQRGVGFALQPLRFRDVAFDRAEARGDDRRRRAAARTSTRSHKAAQTRSRTRRSARRRSPSGRAEMRPSPELRSSWSSSLPARE